MVPFTVPDKPQCVGDNGGDNPVREGPLFWGTPASELSRLGRKIGGDGGGDGMDPAAWLFHSG